MTRLNESIAKVNEMTGGLSKRGGGSFQQLGQIDTTSAPRNPEPTGSMGSTGSVEKPVKRSIRSSDNGRGNRGSDTNSFENVHREMLGAAQGQVNSLRDYENTLLQEQRVINDKNDRNTNAISSLTGLAGSTEADVEQKKTTTIGQQANKGIRAETEIKIQSILSDVATNALAESRARRAEARLDETGRLEARAAAQEKAVQDVTYLTSAGVTYEGLKATDPAAFAHFVDNFGGEAMLKGAFVLNTPQDQIIDKQMKGGSYVIARQNPITGKITIETVDLGLPAEFDGSADLGDRIMFFNKKDPTQQMFVNKGMTSGSGTGIGSGAGQVSDLTSGILANVASLKDLTPSGREEVIAEIYRSGRGGELSSKMDDYAFQKAEAAIPAIDLALEQLKDTSTGFFGNIAEKIPGSDAFKLQSTLETVFANIAFGELTAMRAASPTGGALGNVSEKELALLGNVQASLKFGIGDKLMKDNLNKVREVFVKMRDTASKNSQGGGQPNNLQEYFNQSLENQQRVEQMINENSDLSEDDIWQILDTREGFSMVGNTSDSGNLPQRNKNPGNIKQGGLADSLAIGKDNQGHLIFPDEKTGFLAMQKDIQAKINGNSRFLPKNPTLAQLGKVYAEDPNWTNSVATILGVDPNIATSTLPIDKLVEAIARQEGYYA